MDHMQSIRPVVWWRNMANGMVPPPPAPDLHSGKASYHSAQLHSLPHVPSQPAFAESLQLSEVVQRREHFNPFFYFPCTQVNGCTTSIRISTFDVATDDVVQKCAPICGLEIVSLRSISRRLTVCAVELYTALAIGVGTWRVAFYLHRIPS